MSKRRPKAGLLPLYLDLYDKTTPKVREGFQPFLAEVRAELEARGVDVVAGDICRLAQEFNAGVARFEQADVDCIVTLHLAYSPSLESIDALVKTPLPIVMLDTTMDAAFGQDVAPGRIMFNHGIHGVMDLASMLRRRGKRFEIVAGHMAESNVMDRAAALTQAACAARALARTRALRLGAAFDGMGDFSVDEAVMREALGIAVDQIAVGELAADVEAIPEEAVREEMAADRERFLCEASEETHARSVRIGLALRRRLEAGDYGAFSMNFLHFDSAEGPVDTVPFLEASKAMARGIGYAGEGDVLTASLVGALCRGFGGTTFTEIFCPDWKGNSLFISHMGELNPELAEDRARLVERPFPFTEARNPAILTCALQQGPAVFVNLVPGPNDSFDLIVAPVDILGDATSTEMTATVRGWIRPACGVAPFLEAYSRHGGTHHSALVLGDCTDALCAFASFAGLGCVTIR